MASGDLRRIVLIGKSGAGKSSAANTILGEKKFKSVSSSASVTAICQKERGLIGNQIMEVVDTPGLFDTVKQQEEVMKEIAKCICFAAPGPHVFLVVIQAGRFTNEEQETVKILQKLFGEKAARYTMVLFTRGDDLEEDDVPIERFVTGDEALTKFIQQCGGGYHVFNNRNKDASQVKELLRKINEMIQINGGNCYTNEMLEEAEKAIEKEMAKLQKDHSTIALNEVREMAEKNNEIIQSLNSHLSGDNALVASLKRGAVHDFAATGAVIGSVAGPFGAALGSAVGALIGASRGGCATQ